MNEGEKVKSMRTYPNLRRILSRVACPINGLLFLSSKRLLALSLPLELQHFSVASRNSLYFLSCQYKRVQ